MEVRDEGWSTRVKLLDPVLLFKVDMGLGCWAWKLGGSGKGDGCFGGLDFSFG